MNDFLDLAKKRRSCRAYRPDPVPPDKIKKCLEAVRFAPTACNKQSWKFIITEGELKDRLVGEALGGVIVPNRWAIQAPVMVVIAMRLDLITHRIGAKLKDIDYHLVDAGIAGEHFVLQATELGLGTCWIGWFDKKAVKSILNLSASWDVPSMITLGYPADDPPSQKRKTISEISNLGQE